MEIRKIASALFIAAIIGLPIITMAAPPKQPPTGLSWDSLVAFVTGTLYTIGEAIIIVMLIIAAVMFMTAAGNPERVAAARQTVLYVIVGIVLLLIAASIFGVISSWIGVSTAS
ncbi:MAG: hypothetical protein HYT36_01065 [Candidatus Staskawiczbacteria bacterium]|nr:hypothetical protein [Candidatus Staskawiczbacteria bacterium]